jgi:transaldolase
VAALTALGQSIWQDDITRGMLSSGQLRRSIEEIGIRGLTSNPTIFEKAISGSHDYDEQIAALLSEGASPSSIFEALEVRDIRGACDEFANLYRSSDGGDGFCSIEVFPDAARNPDATREQVRRLWSEVDRPNLMVKIPGTVEATPVVREMLAEGKNINITLLFSIDSYERVAEAYVAALEDRQARGLPLERIASVASFFVSRVDTLVDKLLDEKIAAGGDEAALTALKGRAAVANAKKAYERFQRIFAGERWQRLAAAGARPQRPLWASTGTKNPAYSDVLYVDSLVGPHTVNTMPGKTIEAFLDHGSTVRAVDTDFAEAQATIDAIEAAGISLKAVTDQLETEGIDSFVKSYESLLAGVAAKRAQVAEATAAS